jgi:hypothetical protein
MVRSPRLKEHDVKLSMFMVVAGAAIVFGAPFAGAATSNPNHASVQHHKATKAKKAVKATAKATKATPRPTIYIYVPGYSGPSVTSTPDQTEWCEAYMVNCTDAQLCQNFGENCSTAGSSQTYSDPAAAPSDASPASNSQTVALGSQIAAVGSVDQASTSDTAASSDDSFENC